MTFTITTDSNSIKDANNYNTVGKYNDRVDLERGVGMLRESSLEEKT